MDLAHLHHQLVDAVRHASGMPDPLLHLHAGMAIFLGASLFSRRSIGGALPLAVVWTAELANELLNRQTYGSWRWSDTSGDLLNTLLWPSLLFAGVHLRRALRHRRAGLPVRPHTMPALYWQMLERAGGEGRLRPSAEPQPRIARRRTGTAG
jgi:hypothetical protein